MSNQLIEDLKDFLNDANLTTYETNAYIALLNSSKSDPPTAKEISSKSNVPGGRIYEVLEELKEKGLIEIIESRPKKYRAISLNKALDNLISFHSDETKRKLDYLYDRAKVLESELYDSESLLKKEPSKIFWSTAFGTQSILALYAKCINEAKDEILLNEFINKSTVKILPFAKLIYDPLKVAVDRGIKVKELWCFEYDKRPLTNEQQTQNIKMFREINKVQRELYGLSQDLIGYKTKYLYHRTPTYYDIFDKKRVMFKLQNPLKPHQIFVCMNVVDPSLAEELRAKFLSIWRFEGKIGEEI